MKNTSELSIGILTSCVRQETIQKRLGGNNATVKNILLKLNAKLNGKNHEIEDSSFKAFSANAGVMFVGAVSVEVFISFFNHENGQIIIVRTFLRLLLIYKKF